MAEGFSVPGVDDSGARLTMVVGRGTKLGLFDATSVLPEPSPLRISL